MKSTIIGTLTLLLSSLFVTNTFAAVTCDQVFEWTLRVWYQTTFYDLYTNPQSFRHNIAWWRVTIDESISGDLNRGANPTFSWTPEILAQDYEVLPGQTIRALSGNSPYAVYDYPTSRNNKLLVVYSLDVQGQNSDSSWTRPPVTHNECKYYTITRCGDGVVDTGYETCDPAAPGQSPETCNPTTCTPITQPPACSSTVTGPQTTPLTAGACNIGSPVGFTSSVVGNTTNYTWTCSNAVGTSPTCSASYTPGVVTPGSFDLSIKKYVKSEDVFASVDNTEEFNYTIVVRNNGTGAVTNTTTVRDNLPPNITLRATPSGNGWNCVPTGNTAFECSTTAQVDQDQEFNVITVPVRVENLVFRNDGYMNYAYVYNPQEAVGYRCNADGSMPLPGLADNNWQNPRAVCNEDNNNFDPAAINPPNPNGFDLRLKKFVKGDDESAPVRPGETGVEYTFTLQNLGMLASSGTTIVTDRDFPVGVSIASIAATQGEWTCNQLSATGFSCTTNRSYAMGEYATPITLRANIAANMQAGTYRNVACLSNPYDPNENQILDPDTGKYKVNNCDPAEVVIVPANSFDLSIKKYVADITTGTPQRDGDHQTTNDGTDVNRDILTIPQGGSVRYRFVVRNEWPVTATGTTTVEDTLPNGFTITGSVVGAGWTCTSGANGNRSFSCTRTENLAVGASFPEIVVNAVASSSIIAGEYSNTATVRNPGDTNPDNNTDPANVQIVVGVPSCGSITPSVTGNVSPSTQVTYTCAAVNYTGALSELDYRIDCSTASGSWSASNTGSCIASSSYNTTVPVSCGVRIRSTGVNLSGSFVNSCATSLTTGWGGGGGGSAYVGKKCVNEIGTCAFYASEVDCRSDVAAYEGNPNNCRLSDGAGIGANMCANEVLDCSDGGGGTGWGSSQCGNGVLQPGEECDVIGAVWCENCQLNLRTIPGINPITSLRIRIPALGTIGSSLVTGGVKFDEHRVVVWKGTPVFTLGDEVILDVTTQYQIPIMIPENRLFCLTAEWSAVQNTTLCNPISRYTASRLINWQRYVVLGSGFYQRKKPDNTFENVRITNGDNSVTLFKGFDVATVTNTDPDTALSLRDAFPGIGAANSTSNITLTNRDPVSDPGGKIRLASFQVRTSGIIVGTTGTPVNRSIENFVKNNPQSILSSFLGTIKSSTTTSTTTNTSTSVQNITVNGATSGNISASGFTTIPTLNGNQNIRAIKGNLVIEWCTNDTFTMTGVRTVIVEWNLTLKCNTAYPSNDTTSSWAWIVKGGNIIIDNGDGTVADKWITNLAGVYVVIGDGTTTGRFVALGDKTTNAILKIDGSLYGNATPLFNSRLYARGTSAYDILTTGTIISYSNRALVNPPPLLSQYLGNYSVERVVK